MTANAMPDDGPPIIDPPAGTALAELLDSNLPGEHECGYDHRRMIDHAVWAYRHDTDLRDPIGPITDSEEIDEHPREDAVTVVTAALARLGCAQPVDPYDPEDCGSVASEAVWALIRTGMLPVDRQPPTDLRAAHPPHHHEGAHPMASQPAYRPGDVIRFAPTDPPEQAAWVRRNGREFVVVGIDPDGTLQVWDSDVEEPGGRSVIYVDPDSVVLVARAVPVADWTALDGRSNSSPEFHAHAAVIEDIIRGSAHTLISGRAEVVARTILATLAHKEGFRPGGAEPRHQVPDDRQGSPKPGLELEQPTDLREAIARAAGLAIAQCHDDGPLTWHPCGECQGAPCACSGEPFSAVVADAVLPVVEAHVAAEIERVRASLVAAIHRVENLDQAGDVGWHAACVNLAEELHEDLAAGRNGIAQARAEGAAEALRQAADAYEAFSRNVGAATAFADQHYQAAGPAVPTLWLRHRADSIAAGGEH